MYLHTGEAVAIHGRYLVPVYPLLLILLAMGFNWLLHNIRRAQAQAWVLVAVALLFLQGGSITAWIVRGNPSWTWQQSQPAQSLNTNSKAVLEHITVH